MINLSLTCPSLEVGAGYRRGVTALSGTTGVGWVKYLGDSGGKDSTVCQFENIIETTSIVASC